MSRTSQLIQEIDILRESFNPSRFKRVIKIKVEIEKSMFRYACNVEDFSRRQGRVYFLTTLLKTGSAKSIQAQTERLKMKVAAIRDEYLEVNSFEAVSFLQGQEMAAVELLSCLGYKRDI